MKAGPSSAGHSSGDLNADRRYAYAQDLARDGNHAAAADLLQQTTELTPQWPAAWFALGEAQEQAGDAPSATAAYSRALALDPADGLGAALRLARLGAAPAEGAMSTRFVASLFDQYADRFDDHLVNALHYRGPEVVMDALRQVCAATERPFHFAQALDMGCGTGLMAGAIWRHVDAMRGIDLSPRMVAKALASGFYNADHLHVGDVVGYLDNVGEEQFDLLLAADVMVYMSDLTQLLTGAAQALEPEGLFAFTFQLTDEAGYRLGADMRYHHSEAYVRTVAATAGLDIIHARPCVTRHDAGQPVPGMVMVLLKPARD